MKKGRNLYQPVAETASPVARQGPSEHVHAQGSHSPLVLLVLSGWRLLTCGQEQDEVGRCSSKPRDTRKPSLESLSPFFANRPTCYKSLLGPSVPKRPGSLPESGPKNKGVQGNVPRGVTGVLSALVSLKCSQSVIQVSWILWAHSRDTC